MSETRSYTPIDWSLIIQTLDQIAYTPGENDAVVEYIRAAVRDTGARHRPISVTFSERDIIVVDIAERLVGHLIVKTPERGYRSEAS